MRPQSSNGSPTILQLLPSITVVCNSYPPEIGAAPTRIYNLAQLLKGAGYEVEVVCALPNYPTGRIHPDYRGKWRVTEVLEGIRVHRLPLVPSRARRGFRRMASMATQAASLAAFLLPQLLQKKPALVIVSSPPLPMAAMGAAIAKFTGCKTLLNVSDLWPLSALELGAVKPGPLLRALERLEHRMYRRADAVMGQSEEILAHLTAYRHKPSFLYRNLPQPQPRPFPVPERGDGEADRLTNSTFADARQHAQNLSESTLPLSFGEGPGARLLLYAGQLGPVQGIAEICEAHDFAALGLRLHLYGDGPERARIAGRIAAAPECGIVLHAPVPLAEMSALMARYDAALVPLRTALTGAVPSKLFTAVCAGVPVIFCGGGEGARLVETHSLGWTVPPGETVALSNALRELAALPAEDFSALRDNCRRTADGLFSKASQDEDFLKFLPEIL